MEIYELTLRQLSNVLSKREISSVEVVKAYLERISELDSQIGGYLIVTGEYGLKFAAECDTLRRDGVQMSPLSGIPIAIKDNICTESILTTAGSRMLERHIPVYSATVYSKICLAGMPLLGKLNMDEFGMGGTTERSAFKITKNPHDLKLVPGGSSGGSAAAVAAMLTPAALGSDTGGSVRLPAAYCRVVGLKPTYGRVSRYGLISFASSLDQIGILTRDVYDAAILLELIAGRDSRDATSADIQVPNYTDQLEDGVKEKRIGFFEDIESICHPSVFSEYIRIIHKLEKLGAEIIPVKFELLESCLRAYYIISSAEASSNLARYDGVRFGPQLESEDARRIGFGDEVKRRILLGSYILSEGEELYSKAENVRRETKNFFDKFFLDNTVLILPTAPNLPPELGEIDLKDEWQSVYQSDIFNLPASLAGLPAVSVPTESGLVGVQVIGKKFDETGILKVAQAITSDSRAGVCIYDR